MSGKKKEGLRAWVRHPLGPMLTMGRGPEGTAQQGRRVRHGVKTALEVRRVRPEKAPRRKGL